MSRFLTEAEAVVQFRPFVIKTARKFARTYNAKVEDLIQEGLIAVALSHRQWKKHGGANMLTWIHRPVWWAMWKRVNEGRDLGAKGNKRLINGDIERTAVVSMDEELNDDENRTLHDVIGTYEEPRDVLALRRLPLAMSKLPARERRIIRLRFESDLSLDQVSARIGLSHERIRQLEKIALKKLARFFADTVTRPS